MLNYWDISLQACWCKVPARGLLEKGTGKLGECQRGPLNVSVSTNPEKLKVTCNITRSKLWKSLDFDQQEGLVEADTKPVVQHLDCWTKPVVQNLDDRHWNVSLTRMGGYLIEEQISNRHIICSLLNTILLVGVRTENGHNSRLLEPNPSIKWCIPPVCSSGVEFLEERSLASLVLCPWGPMHCPAWSRGSGHFFHKLKCNPTSP